VVRIGGKDTELLGIDRRVEHEASRVAAGLGIGPEVVAFVEPQGYLVTRFAEGVVGEVTVQDAAPLLRRLHLGPAIPGRLHSVPGGEAYGAIAGERGVRLPSGYQYAKATADRIERRRGPVDLRPCHNDLLAANFIRGADRLWIVDWEYAGM